MQHIAFKDEVDCPTRGILSVIGRNRQGDIVFDFSDNNLIVTASKSALARVCSDASATGYVITQIGIGEDGSGPDLADTGLTNAFTKALSGYTYPAAGQVKFDWYIDYSEANGLEMREFGLITANGTLFARKTRGIITKDDDLSLEGSWTIIY